MKTRPVDLATLKEIRYALHNAMIRIHELKDIYNNPKIQEINSIPDLPSLIHRLEKELRFTKETLDNVAHIQSGIEY